jgi:hypothetical protein
MGAVEAERTLVKSTPELWAELSEIALLAPMLTPFGEIRITHTVPETRIEWEGELARGCVELLPSGFGTRVRLSAQLAPALRAAPAPEAIAMAAPQRRPGLLVRLLGRTGGAGAPAAAPPLVSQPRTLDPALAQLALTAVLDEIGTARHRPFSRDLAAPVTVT